MMSAVTRSRGSNGVTGTYSVSSSAFFNDISILWQVLYDGKMATNSFRFISTKLKNQGKQNMYLYNHSSQSASFSSYQTNLSHAFIPEPNTVALGIEQFYCPGFIHVHFDFKR